MASPCPPVPVATPPLRSPNQSPISVSHTPPPRPPSAPSVYAPRPVRVQAYRPAFSRPFFVSEGNNTTQASQSQQRTSSPLSLGLGVRRSSSASISSLTFISNASDSEMAGGSATGANTAATAPTSVPQPPSSTTPGASEAVDPSRVQIYSPTKDALEELYKIMRRSASSTSPPVGPAAAAGLAGKGFVGLPTRSPVFRYGHRRDASDASDSGISGALSNLYLSSRLSPDGGEFRPSLSPVARNLVRNPMVHDPSFNREPSPNPANAAEDGLRHPTTVNPIVTVNLGDECVTADAVADDISASTTIAAAATVGEVVPPTPIESKVTTAEEAPVADDKKE